MPRAPRPANEAERLAALKACHVLDTPAEAAFDDVTSIAAQVCQTPMALVSLVDDERQWFKSKVGVCLAETDRDHAFCAHAIRRDEPLIIRDATADERTKDNPLVTGEPFVRFYAGIPLRNAEGFALGTLCVLDTRPRDLSPAQLRCLQTLARQVVGLLEARRARAAGQRLDRAFVASSHHVSRAALATLAATLLLTAFVVIRNYQSVARASQQRFERLNEHVLDEIMRRVNLPVYGLKGARGVYAASVSVERDEFAAYVASRNLPVEFPGVLGFGFIQRVMRADLDRFVAAERADDAPMFAVHDFAGAVGTADDLYVVKHIFPLERNRAAWGLDVGSEPARRAAVERAVRTGEPTVTAPIVLPQDAGNHHGFLYLVPVYRNGAPTRTPDERIAALSGVLYAPIIVDDIVAGVVDGVDGLLDFQLFDGQLPTPANQLFGRVDADDGPPDGAQQRADRGAAIAKRSTIRVGGRTWSVNATSTPKFAATTDWSATWGTGVGGAMLSVLLSTVVWSMGRSRAQAFALANRMTADLSAARDLAVGHSRESKASAAMLRRTGELARVGGWEIDLRTQALTWSDEVYRIHELHVGTPVSVAQAVDYYAADAREVMDAAVRAAMADGTSWDLELPLVTARGNAIYVRAQGECVREDGVVVKLCGAFQDITQRKTAEEQLRRTATHDKLTGLPNRALLTERLQECLARATRGGRPRSFAVLFMDFDRFKLTNDTLGHEAGDDLLKQIAARLRAALEPAEHERASRRRVGPTVGRLGGDEFVVILEDAATPDAATALADRLLVALAAPYRILGHEVVSTASIGVVTFDAHYARPDEMLRDADIAMYEAKLAGKGRYVVFDAAMYERVQRRMQTERDLRGAIEAGQLSLAYQPIVSLSTAERHGVEALLRWNHPTRGLIGTDELLPIAEESGLILPIGDWVLRTACEQFQSWRATLGELAPKSISINVSRKQLALRGLPEKVAAILQETGVPPECVHLEVTESAVMKDPAAATVLLNQLHDIGVKVDMDDFGTGHSSLAMLHQFPIDALKIDRSFVKNLDRGRAFAAIVQAIAQLAHNLGIAVVAEGVESLDQLAMLQTLDCELGQGHFFSQPLTADAFEAFVRAPAIAAPAEADGEPSDSIAA